MHSSDQAQALADAIRQHAWNSAVSLDQIPSQMKSMILWPEQKLLHWLARDYFLGAGAICDLGCFVGSSTMSLATGLEARAAERALPRRAVIHSYDLFVTPDDPYTLKRLPDGFQPGDRFRHVFDENTAELKHWIQVHDGDLRDDPWKESPVEILFIDICKCWSTNQMVLQTFFPHLVPGHSIVVHQDFVRVWNPWIPVTMAALDACFEVLAEVESSRVYRCVKPVPQDMLQGDFRTRLGLREKQDLLRQSIASSSPHTAAIHEGALAMLTFMEGDAHEASAMLEQARFSHSGDKQAQMVYANLRETMKYWKTGEAYERQMEDKF